MGLKETRKKAMALMLAACVTGTSTTPVLGADLDALFTDASGGAGNVVFNFSDAKITPVKINFYDAQNRVQISEPSIKVGESVSEISREEILEHLPADYKLVDNNSETFTINDGYVYAEVKKLETKYVNIQFETEDGTKLGGGDILVDKDTTMISYAELAELIALPVGYEFCESGDLYIDNFSQVIIKVRKIETTKYVNIQFETEDGTKLGGGDILVDKDTTIISYAELAELIALPVGYEFCESGDLYIGQESITVRVRKIVKEVSIIYQNRAGKVIKTETMSVDSDAIHINTSKLQAPNGYIIAVVGDLTIDKDNKVYVTLDAAQKNIRIIYKTPNGNIIKSQSKVVAYDSRYINTNELNAPSGYEIISSGNVIRITDNKAIVYVRAINKTITVYYKTSATKVVKTEQLEVSRTAKRISAADLNLPDNYRLATNANSFVIKNGTYVNVPVKLDTRKDVKTLRITCGTTFFYTGKAITPRVTVKDSWKTLKQGRDYTVTYKNNIKRGKASIIIKGTGNYKGQRILTFKIR